MNPAAPVTSTDVMATSIGSGHRWSRDAPADVRGERRPVGGPRDRHESLPTLVERAAAQVGRPVLGDHDVDVVPRRGHRAAVEVLHDQPFMGRKLIVNGAVSDGPAETDDDDEADER